MKDTLVFYKKNLQRLKELSLDCPQCIQDRLMCHHYDYIRDYIIELEAKPPFNEEMFEMFWKAYPVKKAKAYAEKIWKKMKVDDELFKLIMRGVHNYKQSSQWQKDGGRYIPHPTTWLNQERWNDEVVIDGIRIYTEEEKQKVERERHDFYKKNGYYPSRD